MTAVLEARPAHQATRSGRISVAIAAADPVSGAGVASQLCIRPELSVFPTARWLQTSW